MPPLENVYRIIYSKKNRGLPLVLPLVLVAGVGVGITYFGILSVQGLSFTRDCDCVCACLACSVVIPHTCNPIHKYGWVFAHPIAHHLAPSLSLHLTSSLHSIQVRSALSYSQYKYAMYMGTEHASHIHSEDSYTKWGGQRITRTKEAEK